MQLICYTCHRALGMTAAGINQSQAPITTYVKRPGWRRQWHVNCAQQRELTLQWISDTELRTTEITEKTIHKNKFSWWLSSAYMLMKVVMSIHFQRFINHPKINMSYEVKGSWTCQMALTIVIFIKYVQKYVISFDMRGGHFCQMVWGSGNEEWTW